MGFLFTVSHIKTNLSEFFSKFYGMRYLKMNRKLFNVNILPM